MRTPDDHETDPDSLIRFGSVAAVDLAAARCTVTLDTDVETPPLRWLETRMGKTRVWSPPSVDEQVLLLCPNGELGSGIILRGLSCDAFAPADNREIDLIKFDDDAVVSYDAAAHELKIVLPDGGKLAITAPGGLAITATDGVEITADVTITGDVTVSKTLTASTDVVGGGKSLKSHTHPGVQSGGSSTGAPS
jgi:phage baseplate assembly protein V